jgi:predicted aldo/keto reductase-like oxidoreductase
MRFSHAMIISARIEALPEDKKPAACIKCNACAAICPQKLDIPKHLADFANGIKDMPIWAEICRQRAEAAQKIKENEKR